MRTNTCYSFVCGCVFVRKNSNGFRYSVVSLVSRRSCGILQLNSFVHLQQKFFILPFHKMINRTEMCVCVSCSLYVHVCECICAKWMNMLCMLQLSCSSELHAAHFKDNATLDFGVSMKMSLLCLHLILCLNTHIH